MTLALWGITHRSLSMAKISVRSAPTKILASTQMINSVVRSTLITCVLVYDKDFFFFLRRLRVFGVNQQAMFLFYQAVSERLSSGADCHEGHREDWQPFPTGHL